MANDYRDFVLNATTKELIHQLNLEVKQPLTSSQALVNMLLMVLNPSPSVQKKLDSGEIVPEQMLQQLTEHLTRIMDVIDFYRETLESK